MFGNKEAKLRRALSRGQVGRLQELARDKDTAIAVKAVQAMGQIDTDEGFNALILLINSADAAIRLAAAQALGQMGNPHARAHLVHQAAVEADPQVKQALAQALSILHGEEE